MKFTTDCSVLHKSMPILIKKRTKKPQYLKIEATDQNKVMFTSETDSFETDAQVERPGTISMCSINFSKLLDTFNDTPIQFDANDSTLKLSQGKASISIWYKK